MGRLPGRAAIHSAGKMVIIHFLCAVLCEIGACPTKVDSGLEHRIIGVGRFWLASVRKLVVPGCCLEGLGLARYR